MEVLNPKTSRSYHMEFVVVDSDRAVPILGNQTMQQIDLIRVQQHNVMSVNIRQACFTTEQLLYRCLRGYWKAGGSVQA